MILVRLLAIGLLLFSLSAQAQHIELPASPAHTGVLGHLELAEGEAPFYTLALRWQSEGYSKEQGPLFRVRFSADGQAWNGWQTLHPEPHSTPRPAEGISELLFVEPTTPYFEVQLLPGVSISQSSAFEVHLFNPGITEANAASDSPVEARGGCPCPQPQFQGRTDWCPTGNCPFGPNPAYIDVTHLIVHHSAGANSASDWAAVVRSIWNFHVNTNGWDDIGYNWLIDPNGVLYEGRGDGVRGAHFCAQNGATMGVCVMGNFTSILPQAEAVTTLVTLLAWKCCDLELDPQDFAFHGPSGLNLFHISGHKDGCNTACPGDSFYPTLPDVRDAVEGFIAANCAPLAAPTNLVSTAATVDAVSLQWHDNSDNETQFLLERAIGSSGNFEHIATLPENTTSYEDIDLVPDTILYTYRVQAINDQDTSAYSNARVVEIQIVAVQELLSFLPDLQLFPNPAGEQVHLRMTLPTADRVELWVLNSEGRRLGKAWRGQASAGIFEQTIAVSRLAPGMYWLQVQVGERSGSIPFQKH
jgi:hypothetical protein